MNMVRANKVRKRQWRSQGSPHGTTMPSMVEVMRAELSQPLGGYEFDQDDSPEAQATLAEHSFFSAAIESGEWHPKHYGLQRESFTLLGPIFKFFDEHARYGKVPTVEMVQRVFPNFEFYKGSSPRWAAEILHTEADSRALGSAARQVAEALQGRNIDAAREIMRHASAGVAKSGEAGSMLEDIDEPPETERIPSVYEAVEQCGGIPKGSYTAIVARTNVGKSWRLTQHAVAAALGGYEVVLYTMEETRYAAAKRIITLAVPGGGALDYRVGRERALARIAKSGGSIKVFDPSDGPCTPDFVSRHSPEGSVVILDYMGLMLSNSGSRMSEDWSIATEISNSIRQLTLQEGITAITAVQANRSTGKGMPDDTNIALSDAIGQDIDLGISMNRTNRAMPVTKNKVFKARHGGVVHGQWYSRFDPVSGNFEQLDREDALDMLREFEAQTHLEGGDD